MTELNGAPASPEALQTLGLVNYAHFTSIRVDNQHVRGLSYHLERLVRDCRLLFNAELDPDRVRAFIRRATQEKAGSFVARVTIFDPGLELGHPGATAEPHVLVTTRPAGALPVAPLRVRSVCYQRELPAVKHAGLLGAIWHRRQVQLVGYDDALLTDGAGFISEGATWNIAFYDGERVIWPQADVLQGVTMRLLSEVHDQMVSQPVNLADVAGMQAAFATNTSIGVRAVARDRKSVV